MKLRRANEHLDKLKGEVRRYRDNAYTITRQDDLENGMHIASIEQAITPDPLALLVGEFAYSVRSALDHLAWQLALLTTDKPGRQTCFPIDSECPLPSNKSYREKIANISPVALSVIESLQPYKTWSTFKSHPLWQLNKLCNIDKHQVMAVSCVEFAVGIYGVSEFKRRDFDHTIEISVPLSEKNIFQLEVNVPDVVFGEPIDVTDGVAAFEIRLDGLSKIYDFVGFDVVPKFVRFFT